MPVDGRAGRSPTRDGPRDPVAARAERDPADRDVFFVAARVPVRGFGEARRVLFGAALRVPFGAAFRAFFGAAFRVAARFATPVRFRGVVRLRAVLRFRDEPREALRALRVRPPDEREGFREPPRPVFLAFLTT